MKCHRLYESPIPSCGERSAGHKRKLWSESAEGCVCCPLCLWKSYGCAVILNRFSVALLFHYLIGKRVSTPRSVSTPLTGTGEVFPYNYTIQVKLWYYLYCSLLAASQPVSFVHEIPLLVEQEESLSEVACSCLTLHIFPMCLTLILTP